MNDNPSFDMKSSSLPQMMFRRLFFVAGSSRRTTLNLPEIAFAALATSLSLTTFSHVGMFGQPGNERQQMALASAVVADDQNALVVGGRLELQVGDHDLAQLLGHSLRDHEGLDELPNGIGRIRLLKLDDGLDWLELDQIAVFHGDAVLPQLLALVPIVMTTASVCLNWMNSGWPGSA